MRTRALAVLTAVLLLVGATAAAAAAGEVALRDGRGDMWRMDFNGNTEKAPQTRAGDVRRAVFRHGPENVVVRQRFVDVRRIGSYSLYTVRIQNGASVQREVRVEAGPHAWRGAATVFNRRGERLDCHVEHRIDYDGDVVVISVPRACLGTPKRVRAMADSSWADKRRHVFLMDNPHNARPAARTWTRWLRSG